MKNKNTARMTFLQVILYTSAGLAFILLTEWLHGRLLGGDYDISGAAHCVALFGMLTLPFFWLSNITNRAIIIKLRESRSITVSIITAAIFTIASVLAIGAVFSLWQNDYGIGKLRVIIKIFFVAGFFMGLGGALQEKNPGKPEE